MSLEGVLLGRSEVLAVEEEVHQEQDAALLDGTVLLEEGEAIVGEEVLADEERRAGAEAEGAQVEEDVVLAEGEVAGIGNLKSSFSGIQGKYVVL